MKKQPEKDTSERWLLTYSDLMNLLLILFIVLYSMSKTDVAKATAVAESMRKGFNASVSTSQLNQSPTSSKTTSTNMAGGNVSSTNTDYSEFYDQLMQLLKQKGLQNSVEVKADSSSVVITLKDTALFAPGVAVMNDQSKTLMQSIGSLLAQVQYALILVEGYTDSDPIHTSSFPDNLELSTVRANNVNRLLQTCGIPSSKIISMGHGENDPVAPNDTAANKAKNRRVVLTIMKSTSNLTPDQIIAAKDLLSLNSSSSAATAAASSASSASSGSSSSKSSSSKSSSSKSSSSKSSSSK